MMLYFALRVITRCPALLYIYIYIYIYPLTTMKELTYGGPIATYFFVASNDAIWRIFNYAS